MSLTHKRERKETGMKSTRTSRSETLEYLIAFRVFVQADGSLVIVYGNQRLEVTADEVHALLLGTMSYAKVFATLNEKIDTTTLEIANQNGRVV
jgi:hypothetical protein